MSVEVETFKLDALIREIIDENPGIADPHVIAGLTAAATPTRELRAALGESLHWRVRTIYDAKRRSVYTQARSDDDEPDGGTRSARWAAAGPAYKRWRELPVFTGTEWKLQGECLLAEVDAIAAGKFDKADALTVEAKRYERLAAKMRKHKVKHLGDLPEAVVLEVLRWQP